jgi:hypothetical protein
MVIVLLTVVLGVANGSGSNPIDAALHRKPYPWYDAKTGKLQPVVGSSYHYNGPSIPGLGQVVVITLMVLALAALIALLVWTFRDVLARDSDPKRPPARPGGSSQIGALPPGLDWNIDDLWGEAVRRRAKGDYSMATIYLFGHQLLALERLQIIRLAPGRTARQLVRSISDGWIRDRVQTTLGLFERVYYGHVVPSADEFEVVWSEAEALERRIAEGVAT